MSHESLLMTKCHQNGKLVMTRHLTRTVLHGYLQETPFRLRTEQVELDFPPVFMERVQIWHMGQCFLTPEMIISASRRAAWICFTDLPPGRSIPPSETSFYSYWWECFSHQLLITFTAGGFPLGGGNQGMRWELWRPGDMGNPFPTSQTPLASTPRPLQRLMWERKSSQELMTAGLLEVAEELKRMSSRSRVAPVSSFWLVCVVLFFRGRPVG